MVAMASPEVLLLVEDDPAGRELGQFNLERAGYRVETASSGEQALERFDRERHALVITDLRMPGMGGLEVLKAIRTRSPATPVLVITAYGNVDVAVQAMKQGAFDFIGKPFHRDHLVMTVQKALDRRRLLDEVQSLRRSARGIERPLVFESEPMRRLVEMTDRVAPSDATVLVTGETGTGKELVARRLHARSKRAEGPFVAVNCASLPEALLESELFGHERGAFTGADRGRIGRFRQAQGGTLFLDEIGELSRDLQGKLLRVLQEHVVDVVGRDTAVPVDVRVVAATHQNLAERVDSGEFRADLWYRLDVISLQVPPLRERRSDIPALVRHFVERMANERELLVPDELLAELQAREWPGNVRQLENVCERLVILSNGDTLSRDDLPPAGPVSSPPSAESGLNQGEWPPLPPEGLSLIDLERRVIERVLLLTAGNITKAANYLKIPRHILVYRLEKYGIARR